MISKYFIKHKFLRLLSLTIFVALFLNAIIFTYNVSGNIPPSKPTLDGPTSGTKNTEYTYIVVSTDADNDTIQYIINWGDGEVTETEFLPNGTTSTQIHSWMSAGKYTLTVRASDNETVSPTNQTTVLIDVHLVDDIGYLIDDDADGTYDSFHNDTSAQETDVEKQDDGTYLLDDDGDGDWDFVYDSIVGTLTVIIVEGGDDIQPIFPYNEWFNGFLFLVIVLIVISGSSIFIIKRKKGQKLTAIKEKTKRWKKEGYQIGELEEIINSFEKSKNKKKK